jgi:hypothetical protein
LDPDDVDVLGHVLPFAWAAQTRRRHRGTSNNVRGHKFGLYLGPVFDCLPGFFFRPLLRLSL